MKGSIINGVQVLGDAGDIEAFCKQFNVTSVIAASDDINDDFLFILKQQLAHLHVKVLRFEMRLNDLN